MALPYLVIILYKSAYNVYKDNLHIIEYLVLKGQMLMMRLKARNIGI